MGYAEAMQAAGATVFQYKEFGSCQGDWWALVSFNGQTGYVHGSYGSCSGCDSFQAEFGWSDEVKCEEHEYTYDDSYKTCADCAEKQREYDARLKAFGLSYLDNIRTQEQAVAQASENLEWDMDAQEMVDWLSTPTPESEESRER